MSKYVDYPKRLLIRYLTLTPFFTITTLSQTTQNQLSRISFEKLKPALLSWQENERASPVEYLNKVNILNNDFNQLKTKEFQNGNVIIVDGLILCKSEVAIIAAIALKKI